MNARVSAMASATRKTRNWIERSATKDRAAEVARVPSSSPGTRMLISIELVPMIRSTRISTTTDTAVTKHTRSRACHRPRYRYRATRCSRGVSRDLYGRSIETAETDRIGNHGSSRSCDRNGAALTAATTGCDYFTRVRTGIAGTG
jgi:hypothetical protein